MTARHVFLLGLILSALALLAIVATPAAALHAWLAAAFLWSGLPLGSLGLLMVMRLTGGRWDQALPPFLEAGALTLPLSLLTLVPVTAGLGILYPWAAHPLPGFKGIWLSPLLFVLRSLALYLGAGALVLGLVTRRWPALVVAAAGLIFLLPMLTFVLTDWLLSLEPGFHSSGFPLYAMTIQFNVALMAAVLLLCTYQPERTAALGAIMLTLTLLWLYLAFTHYIIIWSGNLTDVAGWYRERSSGGWGAAYAVCAVTEAGAFLALVSPEVRQSASALRAIAVVVLLSKVIEAAWLVLPASGPVPLAVVALYVLAAVGLGMTFLAAQVMLLRLRIAARAPA
jgi:hypothetical protein